MRLRRCVSSEGRFWFHDWITVFMGRMYWVKCNRCGKGKYHN